MLCWAMEFSAKQDGVPVVGPTLLPLDSIMGGLRSQGPLLTFQWPGVMAIISFSPIFLNWKKKLRTLVP